MSAIDRVMRAYASKHDLNPEQTAIVRSELSRFIEELMSGKRVPWTGQNTLDALATSANPSEEPIAGHVCVVTTKT